jgi:hypothetical protein
MRVSLIALVAATALTFGCSKKSALTPVAADPAVDAAAAAAPPIEDNPMIAAGLDELTQKVKQQQYEAAVGSIVAMSDMPKSDKQQALYTARLRQTQDALAARAAQGDQAAQQNLQMLGRMMTGR